jgi:hypothetical protein
LTLLSPERGEPENALTAFIADKALMCRYPVSDALPSARIPTSPTSGVGEMFSRRRANILFITSSLLFHCAAIIRQSQTMTTSISSTADIERNAPDA